MGKLVRNMRRLGQMLDSSWGNSMRNCNHQLILVRKLYRKYGLELKKTSSACPEQYEVFKDGVQVAYYRLRHGEFRVDHPTCLDETIFYAEPYGDGIFDDDERLIFLTKAMREVLKKLNA